MLAAIILLVSGNGFAQAAQPKPKRPKIGVALAGGAALGLSHIGILAGTSMGGLVGGLYPTGHRAPEMKEFIRQVDWEDPLRLSPAYSDLSFRRKKR